MKKCFGEDINLNKSNNISDFKVIKSDLLGENGHCITLDLGNNNKSSSESRTQLSYVVKNNELISTSIIETNFSSLNETRVNYSDINGRLLSQAVINSDEGTINYSKSNTSNSSQSQQTLGDRTIDCMQDVYSNHGWVSVWASIQTAFIPATAAAIGAACALSSM